MYNLDLEYLGTIIGNLSGVPIRLYDGEKLIFLHSLVSLPRDPVELYRDDIWHITEHIGYYVTRLFNYYGIVNFGTKKIIIGPTRQLGNTDQELRELAFQLDVPSEDTDEFLTGMKGIIRMPLESIMQILCTLNYILNREKLTLQDIAIYDSEQNLISKDALSRREAQSYVTDNIPVQDIHNTFTLEQSIMTIVRKGDTASLQAWIKSAPAVRGGIIAAEQLRQVKNTFIVSATLASRAAIRGGLEVDDAFNLSDAYIQKCELLNSPDKIMNLQYHRKAARISMPITHLLIFEKICLFPIDKYMIFNHYLYLFQSPFPYFFKLSTSSFCPQSASLKISSKYNLKSAIFHSFPSKVIFKASARVKLTLLMVASISLSIFL